MTRRNHKRDTGLELAQVVAAARHERFMPTPFQRAGDEPWHVAICRPDVDGLPTKLLHVALRDALKTFLRALERSPYRVGIYDAYAKAERVLAEPNVFQQVYAVEDLDACLLAAARAGKTDWIIVTLFRDAFADQACSD